VAAAHAEFDAEVTAAAAGKRRRSARTALGATILGIAVFLALNIALQLSPPHYTAVSQAVSDLAVGPYGWAMDIAFFLSGVSILSFVAGAFLATSPKTRPLVGFLLLAVWGLASAALAFVPADVVDTNGYPATLKAFAASTSVHGKLHVAIAAVVFLSMVLGLVASSVYLGREPRLRPAQRTARLIAAAAFAGLLLTDPLGTRGITGSWNAASASWASPGSYWSRGGFARTKGRRNTADRTPGQKHTNEPDSMTTGRHTWHQTAAQQPTGPSHTIPSQKS
jgi:hypothetical membrane protein